MAETKTKTAEPKPDIPAKVPIYIPKTGPGDDERYIAVNGRRILVQTNKTVYVEPCFAEVWQNSVASDEAALSFIEANMH